MILPSLTVDQFQYGNQITNIKYYAKFETILNDEQELYASLVISKNDDLIVNFFGGKILIGNVIQDFKMIGVFIKPKFQLERGQIDPTNNEEIFLFSSNPPEKQNEWTLIEKINKNYEALCFIDDANLAFISSDQNVITIYEISAKLKQYQNLRLQGKISTNYLLIEYNQQKQLLLGQKDNRVYLIQKIGQGKYVLQQKILFPNEELLVSFNKNGNLLLLNSTLDQLDSSYRKQNQEDLQKLVEIIGCFINELQ